MNRYDTIIIGAGHNGLVCAAYLARAGQNVLLLESSDTAGGLAARREFHPGFSTSVAHLASHFPPSIVRDLALESHGLRAAAKPLPMIGLSPDGKHVVVKDGSIDGVAERDTESYREFAASMQRFADTLQPFWLKTIPRAVVPDLAGLLTFGQIGLKLRLLGRDDLREFLRVVSLPARDLMDENFESEILKAMLSWDGLIGSKMAPRSPNSAVLPMLYRLSGEFRGEPGSLIDSLLAATAASGVEIRLSTGVERILVEAHEGELAARGVLLAGGERIEADRVVSSADPQYTFFRLVGVEHLEIEFTNRIRRLRCEGYVAKAHLALDGIPEFTGLDEPGGRIFIAPEMDAIEFAFDDAKYGACSQQPVMEFTFPSLQDAALSPPGQHVLSAHVMYAPYRLKGGWNEVSRAAFLERVIDTLAAYAPGIRENIIHAELLTPADLECHYHVTGGHWHHTEFALDQALMMRPTYQAAQYSTPLPGLFLCGAGSHPGGDLTGAPGHNAAHEILRR